eukprot:3700-Heterococcus_DN1.PRE.2
MGGKEAAAIIRQHNKHIPIIFLTGEIAATMKESTKEFAPAHLLLKPCNKLTLIASAKRLALLLLEQLFVYKMMSSTAVRCAVVNASTA